jgi:phage tail-like protein
MAGRDFPYGAFNFAVAIDGSQAFGGFQEVNGLMSDIKVAEYRTGVDRENHVRKVPGMHAVGDVTLKRGIVSSKDLFAWIEAVRRTGPLGKRTVVITMNDEAGNRVQGWELHGAAPLKYTGPTFSAKAGTDVATEELVLSVESLSLQQQ